MVPQKLPGGERRPVTGPSLPGTCCPSHGRHCSDSSTASQWKLEYQEKKMPFTTAAGQRARLP